MEFKPVVDVLTDAITKVQADGEVTIHGRGDGAVIVRHANGEETAIDPTELTTTPAEDATVDEFPAPEAEDAEGEGTGTDGDAEAKAAAEAEAAEKAADADKSKGGRSKS